ncbi:MAG: hypothetical protein ACAI38_08120 [Myxococcota bacterium]
MDAPRLSEQNPYAPQILTIELATNSTRASLYLAKRLEAHGAPDRTDDRVAAVRLLRKTLDAGHQSLEDIDQGISAGMTLIQHGVFASMGRVGELGEAQIFLINAVRTGERLLDEHAPARVAAGA